jgi:hypothetical protein
MVFGSGRFWQTVSCIGLAATLSGCIAAAVPVMMAASVGVGAMSGFEVYKVVQLSSGGSVHAEFPGKDGKTLPPSPLPSARRVAVWPRSTGDVAFAEHLIANGRFQVTPPATVSAMIETSHTPWRLANMTDGERQTSFQAICARADVDIIFASLLLGTGSDQNTFSFSRANVTYKYELLAYSCTTHSIVSRDHMAAVVEIGDKVPTDAEINNAIADARVDRIIQAMNQLPSNS